MSSYSDEHERKASRRRIIIIVLSSLALVGIVIGIVFGVQAAGNKKKPEGNGDLHSVSVKAVCDVTLYKDKCLETVGSAPNAGQLSPKELFNYAVQITLTELSKVLQEFSPNGEQMDIATSAARGACVELLELAVHHLNEITNKTTSSSFETVDNLRTWLSSVDTYQETCLDALIEAKNPSMTTFGENQLKNSTEMTSNALAIITWLGKIADHVKLPVPPRRLMAVSDDLAMMEGRRLLENDLDDDLRKIATIVVAQDGSGKYKKISDALKEVKEKNEIRTIIYVKKGVYVENVRVEKNIWNVVMVGDGQKETIVSGGLNNIDGTPTFQTATFAVFGKGFMARDMGFRNTAGPEKHQAVALMVSADLAVFYRCTMESFQDTLYAHAHRQFYRECTIVGTVDFIFGNAAVVFQSSDIRVRRPMKGQVITITAQGKKDPNHNTGISIHSCSILPLDDLTGVKTFLGRPWKDFSTTVIMKTYLDGFIDPQGWLPWSGDSAPDTIFYGEYLNYGPGALTTNRVKWRGLKTSLTTEEANRFAVKSLINGETWLPATKVPFKSEV